LGAWVSAALLFGVLGGVAVHAERDPLAGPADGRMRTVVYNPRDVVRIVGHYGFTTMVQFADYEVVESISIGDSVAWQVVKNGRGNMVWVKPIEQDAETNLTVVTRSAQGGGANEQRIYIFSLEAEREKDHRSEVFTWHVRFQYPEDEAARLAERAHWESLSDSSLVSVDGESVAIGPSRWNFQYTFAGDKSQVPLRIFDNGRFTYLEFADVTDVPAIFLVDDERNEALVNSVREGKYLVIHRVGRQFTLRNGDEVTCIFNEAFEDAPPLDQGSPVERSKFRANERADVEASR